MGCDGAKSPTFNVNVIPFDPSTYPQGTGSFYGKTCFDIVDGNDSINNCGSKASRGSHKTVFADRIEQDGTTAAPYSGVQVYTFTPPGTVSHVQFLYTETAGISIDRIVPQGAYATQDNINTACKVTVYYKSSLDNDLKGTTHTTGNKVTLYAIYNDGPTNNGTDRLVALNVSLQDCGCCNGLLVPDGAYNTYITDANPLPEDSERMNNNGSARTALLSSSIITKAGGDLCYYYRDASATYNWHDATGSSSAQSKYANGGVCQTTEGVDASDADVAW
jgi:hypothetical protein